MQVIEAAKKRGAEKAKLTKSMIVLDVKPWDDTTDMAELEKAVRSVVKDGLLWGSCELSNTCVPVNQQLQPAHVAMKHARCWSLDHEVPPDQMGDSCACLHCVWHVVLDNKVYLDLCLCSNSQFSCHL